MGKSKAHRPGKTGTDLFSAGLSPPQPPPCCPQGPCIAGAGALCTLPRFLLPEHPVLLEAEKDGDLGRKRPPRPFTFPWSLTSRLGLELFTPHLWWRERRGGDFSTLTSCRAGNTESGKCLQASDSPRHTQTECRTLQRRVLNKRRPNALLVTNTRQQ